ncbi:unnamed protein product [Musa textilis]
MRPSAPYTCLMHTLFFFLSEHMHYPWATSIGLTFLSSTSGQISGVSCTKASHNNNWASKSTLLALDQRRFETLIWLSIFLMSPVASKDSAALRHSQLEIDRWPCVHRIIFGSRANPDGSINSARFRTCRFFLHLDISSSLGRSFNFFGKSRK